LIFIEHLGGVWYNINQPYRWLIFCGEPHESGKPPTISPAGQEKGQKFHETVRFSHKKAQNYKIIDDFSVFSVNSVACLFVQESFCERFTSRYICRNLSSGCEYG